MHFYTTRFFRIALLSGFALMLAACGFQLRGSYNLPFDSIYIDKPDYDELAAALKRSIRASGNTRIAGNTKEAQVTLKVVADSQAKNILSIGSDGRVREFQLVRTFGFRVIDSAGQDWITPAQIIITRDISFNDTQVLSKESEEALLWRDMQGDMVQQIMRRLAVAKQKTADELDKARN